jgi:hypothetical protein
LRLHFAMVVSLPLLVGDPRPPGRTVNVIGPAATVPIRETDCAVFAGPVRKLSCGVAIRRPASLLAARKIFVP